MSKVKLEIWGRTFELSVIYDKCTGEEILESQKSAAEVFFEAAPYDQAKSKVEKYIAKQNKDKLPQTGVDNIFKYVMPKSIYVLRDSKVGDVAILCNYKFDMEHGLALIFSKGTLKSIDAQDSVL